MTHIRFHLFLILIIANFGTQLLFLVPVDIEYSANYDIKYSKTIRDILRLFHYAPNTYIEHISNSLQEYKKLYDKNIKIPNQ